MDILSTGQQAVDYTRQYLMGGNFDEMNQLAANYSGGGSTLTFSFPLGSISAGARLSSGLNTFYVWSVSGNVATVAGGQQGSTDGPLGIGDTVLVRPRFTDNSILTAINDDLNALSTPQVGLFQVKTFDLAYNNTIDGYDLTGLTDIQNVFKVSYQEPGPYKDWPEIESSQWRLERSMLTTDFASGNAIRITQPGWPGYDIRIHYKAPFGTLTGLGIQSATGLSSQAVDIPCLGAAIRLMAGREIKRNFTETQPDTRRATEVPPGAVANSYRGLQLLYQQRIAAEAARLQAMWPYKMD